jgi:hypothetical protein
MRFSNTWDSEFRSNSQKRCEKYDFDNFGQWMLCFFISMASNAVIAACRTISVLNQNCSLDFFFLQFQLFQKNNWKKLALVFNSVPHHDIRIQLQK